MNFGTSEVTSYAKHSQTGPVKAVIYNQNSKVFVSYNDKQIHVWNELTGANLFKVNFYEETKSHTIAAMCYSLSKGLYFVIATDFKMHVFNENMINVDSLISKTRLVHQAYFYEEE